MSGVYVNAGDTLTIQLQGNSPTGAVGAAVGLLISFGNSIADQVAQNIVSYMGGQGFATALDSDNVNTDGTIFVQIDVTPNIDYASSNDVLSIAETAWYNAGTNQLPSSAIVTDINGAPVASALTSTSAASALGSVANPSTITAPILSGAGSILSGVQSIGTTALILIGVIILALLYFLTTEGGQTAAKLALA